jgi:hypothetical protein
MWTSTFAHFEASLQTANAEISLMLSDQLDCKDSEDPLRLTEFVKNYASNGSS